MSILNNTEARKKRRGFGISAYVGPNGSGKSLCMVRDAMVTLEAGNLVLSTVRLQDYENPRPCDDDRCASNPDRLDHFKMRPTAEGRAAIQRNQMALYFHGPNAAQEPVEMVSTGVHLAAHPCWIPWDNWEQFRTFRFGEALADEMTGIAEARSSQSLPTVVLNHFQQLRRAGILFRYTLPDWRQADVSVRRPTQSVTLCQGFLKKTAPLDGEQDRLWTIRRLYRWQTYEARLLTELDEGKRADLRHEVNEWHWGPKSLAWSAYDTFAEVLSVGVPTESGRCHKCGGKRPETKCGCGGSHAEPGAAGAGAPARRRAAARTDVPAPAVMGGGGAAASPFLPVIDGEPGPQPGNDTPAAVVATAAAL